MLSKLQKQLVAGALAIVALGTLLRVMVNIEMEPRRQNAQRGICFSNLKQISFALQMYAQDNANVLPRAATPSGNENWMRAVGPYLNNPKLFSCPTNKNGGYSYVWNDAYAASGDGLTSPSGQPLSRVQNPPQTILIADGTGDFRLKWELPQGASVHIVDGNLRLGNIVGRHFHLPYILFCDGHVAAYGVQQVFQPKTIKGKSYFAGLSIEDD